MLSVRAARLNSKGLTCRVFFFDARLFSLWCSLPFPPLRRLQRSLFGPFFQKQSLEEIFFESRV